MNILTFPHDYVNHHQYNIRSCMVVMNMTMRITSI